MPKPEKTDDDKRAAEKKQGTLLHLRVPHGLKGRAVKASRKRESKLTPWLIEAIEEKCDRELGPEE